jgi:hypothetical protein
MLLSLAAPLAGSNGLLGTMHGAASRAPMAQTPPGRL